MSAEMRRRLLGLGLGEEPRSGSGAPAPPSQSTLQEALRELGFGLDADRGLWCRSSRLPLAELGLGRDALGPGRLQSLAPGLGGALYGPVLCFDLETTGLQRGTGTVPFLYGFARVVGDEVQLEQWMLPELGEEAPLVEAAYLELRRAGLVVTYNGSSFDLPLLRTRAVMAALVRPWPGTPHLDLLPLVRRLFRHRLVRCSLRRAEEELLGIPRVGDISGGEAPERFRAFLRRGDPQVLVPVLDHNRQDLLSLLRLLHHLERHLQSEPRHRSDWYSLGRLVEERGEPRRAEALYLGAQEASPPPLDRAAALRRARLLRRLGEEADARRAWQGIWARWQDPEAAEALCVDLEHRTGEVVAALELAQQALRSAPVGWDRRFAKRIWRLQAKLDSHPFRPAAPVPPVGPGRAPDPVRPWSSWLPGGNSYEAWLALRRGRPPKSGQVSSSVPARLR